MAAYRNKIGYALDEDRILVLGTQVVVGFQFQWAFQPGFSGLPRHCQVLSIIALGLMLVALGLLIAPCGYHRIADDGYDTRESYHYTVTLLLLALWPFALGLGAAVYIAVQKLMAEGVAIAMGTGGALLALLLWLGIPLGLARRTGKDTMDREQDSEEKTRLSDKLKHVLTEARVVLPGAQALFGFQFTIMLTQAFDRLPAADQYVHLGSLTLVVLSTMLLMAPPAYHRIVERGEETEHFHRLAGRFLLAAMVPLAFGIAGDFYVFCDKVTGAPLLSIAAGFGFALFFPVLWFAYPLVCRQRQRQRRQASWGRSA